MALRAPFTRSEERWLGGVAAGLAHRLGIDPALTRSLFLLLTFVGGLGLILYGLGWMFLPDGDRKVLAFELFRGRPESGLVGAAFMLIVGLFRPIVWSLGFGFSGGWYWRPGWLSFWYLNVFALVVALVFVAAIVLLSWNARRRRATADPIAPAAWPADAVPESTDGFPAPPPADLSHTMPMAQATETQPLVPYFAEQTEQLIAPSSPGETAQLPVAHTEIIAATPAESAAHDAEPFTPAQKSWYAQNDDPDYEPLDFNSEDPLPDPRKPRRPRAGSRHVQATLAATLLAIAAILLVNSGQVSFRSIGQALGVTAIIWGASTAVAAARGRRAGGTALIATVVTLACVPALIVVGYMPSVILDQAIDPSCGRGDPATATICAVRSSTYTIDDAMAERLSNAPLVLYSGLGSPHLRIDTDEPLTIAVQYNSAYISALLPEWTVDTGQYEQVLDETDTIWDIADNQYTVPTHHGFRADGEIITFTSPGADPSPAAHIYLVGGIGDYLSIESVQARNEVNRTFDEMMRIEDEWWQNESDGAMDGSYQHFQGESVTIGGETR